MMQWVGLAWCCLLLSSQVKSTLDPDQRSSPANATASQRALSVFSVVKVFFFSQYIFGKLSEHLKLSTTTQGGKHFLAWNIIFFAQNFLPAELTDNKEIIRFLNS